MEKFFKLWLPVICWAGLIYSLSGIPNLKSDLEFDFLLRKIAHITEYFILTFLLMRAFRHTFRLSMLDLIIYPSAAAMIYAASDEYHQSFITGRRGDVKDIMIDALGIAALYIAVLSYQNFIKIKRNSTLDRSAQLKGR